MMRRTFACLQLTSSVSSVAVMAAVLAIGVAWSGQSAGAAAGARASFDRVADDARYVTVVEDNAAIRSNASSRAYVFGQVAKESVLKIVDERDGWMRVAIAGPAFAEFFGYLKYPQGQEGRYALHRANRRLTSLGTTIVYAPNLDADYNPAQSWRPILRMPAETTLQWIDSFTTEREIIHRVRLPEAAEGWINPAHVRNATSEEVNRWRQEQERSRADEERAQRERRTTPPADTPARDTTRDDADQRDDAATQDADRRTDQQTPPVRDTTDDRSVTTDRPARDQQDADASQDDPPATPPDADRRDDDDDPRQEPADDDPEPAQDDEEREAVEEDGGPARLAKMLDTLESAFTVTVRQQADQAELEELQRLYLQLAAEAADFEGIPAADRVRRFARSRAEQLDLHVEIQRRRAEIRELQARLRIAQEDAEARRVAIESRRDYVAIGILNTSTIYDGKRLPRLYRVQDPDSGRTIAYVKGEDDEFEFVGMIRQLVGVVGDRHHDPGLRLTVISPTRIDILSPRQ